jgi:ribose transport system ATP-binding protein
MAMSDVLLEFQGITKTYPGVRALSAVDMTVRDNEIVSLVGENGAGKSTILNVASGVIHADEGQMLLRGEPFKPRDYHDAMLHGVSRVFQEQALVPNLTVYENMLLSHENRFSFHGIHLNRKAMIKRAMEELAMLDLEIDPSRRTEEFDISTRQVIEIAKACSVSSLIGIEKPVILLDEPTAALSGEEVKTFFDLIRRLKEKASFVFVSHRLNEVLALSDRIVVLKDGAVVAEVAGGEVEEKTLHQLMVGRVRDEDYYKEARQRMQFGSEVMRVENFSKKGAFQDVSFSVNEGEIVGIGGVLGSGKAELGRAIAGATPTDAGSLWIKGREAHHPSLNALMAQGVGYVPGERHLEGIILNLPVSWNITLASMHDRMQSGPGLIRVGEEKEAVKKFIKDLRIKTPTSETLCYALSGGNQQKVVLAKWLLREPRLLVLDNPTFGIDVGNKEEIYVILRGLAEQGMAIVLISDELLELIGISNRVLIMKDGIVAMEVAAPPQAKPSEAELVKDMV